MQASRVDQHKLCKCWFFFFFSFKFHFICLFVVLFPLSFNVLMTTPSACLFFFFSRSEFIVLASAFSSQNDIFFSQWIHFKVALAARIERITDVGRFPAAVAQQTIGREFLCRLHARIKSVMQTPKHSSGLLEAKTGKTAARVFSPCLRFYTFGFPLAGSRFRSQS